MNNTIKFEVQDITDIEKINPLFSKAKIKVMYTGKNRNQSYFSRESVENAIPTLYNIPIVGEYLEEVDNFGGHGGKIEITDDKGIKFIQTTVPYGTIPSEAEVYWENVPEEDGTVNEYLIIDGAILWSGRYDELNDIHGNFYGQSMEIEIENGQHGVVDGEQYFIIQDFFFSALCILGRDKDGEGHVEPAFEGANIVAYSLNEEDFKQKFNKMIKELKYTQDNDGKGGKTEMDEKLKLIESYSLTEEDMKSKEIDMEQYTVEELEEKIKEEFVGQVDESKGQDDDTSGEDFSLTASQLTDEIKTKLSKHTFNDEWGDEMPHYFYIDRDEDKVIVEDFQQRFKLFGISYTTENDSVSLNMESIQPVKVSYEYIADDENQEDFAIKVSSYESAELVQNKQVNEAKKSVRQEYEGSVESLQSQMTELEAHFENLQRDYKELEQFKENKLASERAEKEQAIFQQFEGLLSTEAISAFKEKSGDYSLQQLEDALNIEFAKQHKKNFNFNQQQQNLASFSVDSSHKDENDGSQPSWAKLMK